MLALHRARQGFVKARTAQANQIRGLLAEYGIVIPQGIGHITKRLPEILEDGENELPGVFRQLLERLGEHLKELDRQVGALEAQIQSWHRENDASQKLAQIPGIGPITASALVTSIGEALDKPGATIYAGEAAEVRHLRERCSFPRSRGKAGMGEAIRAALAPSPALPRVPRTQARVRHAGVLGKFDSDSG